MRRSWLIGGGVALVLFFVARAASASQRSVIPMLDVGLSKSQREAAAVIERVVLEKMPEATPELIMAIIANAWRESALNPRAKGDASSGTPHSFGLFQLNTARGVGIGLDEVAMMDPAYNTGIIMDREVLTSRGKKLQAANALPSPDAGDMASIFVYDIERPGDKPGEAQKARNAVASLFGV